MEIEYDEPENNYLRIVRTIEFLQSGDQPGLAWYKLHYGHLITYRNAFPNFENCNLDNESMSFRGHLSRTEYLIEKLIYSYKVSRRFDLVDYLEFNNLIKIIVEDADQIDRLTNELNALCGKTD